MTGRSQTESTIFMAERKMTITQDSNDIIYQVGADTVLTELANYTARRIVDTDELRNLIAKARLKLDELENVLMKAMNGGGE